MNHEHETSSWRRQSVHDLLAEWSDHADDVLLQQPLSPSALRVSKLTQSHQRAGPRQSPAGRLTLLRKGIVQRALDVQSERVADLLLQFFVTGYFDWNTAITLGCGYLSGFTLEQITEYDLEFRNERRIRLFQSEPDKRPREAVGAV